MGFICKKDTTNVTNWIPYLWNHPFSIRSASTMEHIQCVPIKRKPVLSVRYLHCHARFNQTICFIIKGIFSSFILTPNTWWYLNAWLKRNDLNSCMSKSICAEKWCWADMTKFRLANPCQNKESKQKKHDKRDKRRKKLTWFMGFLSSGTNFEPVCHGHTFMQKPVP